MKIVGKLARADALVPQPGYPKITETEDNFTVSVRYVCTALEMRYLPKVGEAYRGETGFPYDGDKLVLSERRAEPKAEGGPWVVDLVYAPEPLYDEVSGSGRNQVRKTYELTTEDMDVPLAQHPRYRLNWDHVLAAAPGNLVVPSWWSSAVSAVSAGASYRWLGPGEQPPEGWSIIRAETKPGVESFRSGVVRVHVTKTARKRAQFDSEARRQDYTIGAPGKTFGVSGTWLRGGSVIRRNGRLWELSVDYINAKAIDTDLYDT